MSALYLDFSERALAELTSAGESIRIYQGDAAAEAFSRRVEAALVAEAARAAQEMAENATGKLSALPDGAASIRWSQPVYRLRIETASKRRRRNAATGLYYVYYALHDGGGTGTPDTLRVLAFRHSAARPLSDDGQE